MSKFTCLLLLPAYLALSACSSLGTQRPAQNIDYGASTRPATMEAYPAAPPPTDQPPSPPARPSKAQPRPLPRAALPPMYEPEAAPEHPPGYSASPYGVDPYPVAPPAEPVTPEPPPVATPALPALPDEPAPAVAEAPPQSPALTPLPEPKVFNLTAPPAVLALESDIESNLKAGSYADAAASLERAIRIQPKNPELWHVLAEVRLKQQQPGLAEDLAKKSNLLAKGNADLIRSNWAIIAESLRLKGDTAGAADAMAKAR